MANSKLTEIKVQVKKKSYEMGGRKGTYYVFLAEFEGETIKLKPDDRDKKLVNHFLDKMDIPLEEEDKKGELMQRLLSGEYLSPAEKALLEQLLSSGKEGGEE